jgi:glycosyltransferase involved in cell wall biosynthesis
MPDFTNRLAFVVPTKDRPKDLRRMLASVANQSCLPDQIIIVDGGEETVDDAVKEFPTLNIRYLRVYPPSLSKQRNAGMAAIDSSITLAGYLDDDLVLEPGATEAMLTFLEEAPEDVGGARFNIITDHFPRAIWLKSLFLLDSRERGIILRSGHPTMIGPVAGNKYVRWLSGGATVWRRKAIKEFAYDEWFVGTGYLEDIDYSYRVGMKYKLAVVADARVQHLSYPVRKDRNYLLGKWQAVNRMYLVKKHEDFSVPLCYWSMLGQLLLNLGTGIWKRDSGPLRRAWGNLVGLLNVVQGRIERIPGTFK